MTAPGTDPLPGCLYLVPAPLDFGCDSQTPLADILPAGSLQIAARLTHWVCENAKSTRAYLKRIDALHGLAVPLQRQQITELPHGLRKNDTLGARGAAQIDTLGAQGAARLDTHALLAAALAGHDMGLVSEAGMPAVADPGAAVVRAAHELGIPVLPLVGPVSLMLALAASGLNGQNFAFVGYLPQDGQERIRRIKELEGIALKTGQTQMFIETPYRNTALWQALVQQLQAHTRLALASALTLPQAQVRSQLVRQWRQQPTAPDDRTPAVFALGR